MAENKSRFIKMLQMEFEDLKCDIQELIQKAKSDHDKGKITNYVFMENIALFENELMGLADSIQVISEIKVDEYENLNSLISNVENKLTCVFKEHDFWEAGHVCVQRKIEKVKKYLFTGTIAK